MLRFLSFAARLTALLYRLIVTVILLVKVASVPVLDHKKQPLRLEHKKTKEEEDADRT